MSEFSMRMQSKKESLRCSRLQNAEKILQAVHEEKAKLLKLVDDIAAPAALSYQKLLDSKNSPTFKQTYGTCLVDLQDTLNKLQSISVLVNDELESSDEEEAGLTEQTLHGDSQPTPVSSSTVLEAKVLLPAAEPLAGTAAAVTSTPSQSVTDESQQGLHTVSAIIQPVEPIIENQEVFLKSIRDLYQNMTLQLDEAKSMSLGHYEGPNFIWLQPSPTALERITEIICLGLSVQTLPALDEVPKIGDLVLAKYSVDDFYYRAVIKSIDNASGQVEVFFVDYGNFEVCPMTSLLTSQDEMKTLPPQACLVTMKEVSPPNTTGLFSPEAMKWLEDQLALPLRATLGYLGDVPVLTAELSTENSRTSLNTQMLHKRFASKMSDTDIRMKYSKMNDGQKAFYQNLLPQLKRKKQTVNTPIYHSSETPPRAQTLSQSASQNTTVDDWEEEQDSVTVSKADYSTTSDLPTAAIPNPDLPTASVPHSSASQPAPLMSLQDSASNKVCPSDFFKDHKEPEEQKIVFNTGSKPTMFNTQGGKHSTAPSRILPAEAFHSDNIERKIHGYNTRLRQQFDKQVMETILKESRQKKTVDKKNLTDSADQETTENASPYKDTAKTNRPNSDRTSSSTKRKPQRLTPDEDTKALLRSAVKRLEEVDDRLTNKDRASSSKFQPPAGAAHRMIVNSLGSHNNSNRVRGGGATEFRNNPPPRFREKIGFGRPQGSDQRKTVYSQQSPTSQKSQSQSDPIKKDTQPTLSQSMERENTKTRSSTQSDTAQLSTAPQDNSNNTVIERISSDDSLDERKTPSDRSFRDDSPPGSDTELPEDTSQVSAADQNITAQSQVSAADQNITAQSQASAADQNITAQSQASADDTSKAPVEEVQPKEPLSVPIETPKKPRGDETPMLSPETDNNKTPTCLFSPPSVEESAKVPAQKLKITDTKERRRVCVSHVKTPTEIYINLIDRATAKSFQSLETTMDEYYERVYNSMLRTMMADFSPKIGDYCVARSTQFDSYYRGEVIGIRKVKDFKLDDVVIKTKDSDKTIQVFYIDYGSDEWVSPDSVFPLMPKFARAPALAWRCRLIDVYPVDGVDAVYPGGWDKKAVETVKSLIPDASLTHMYIANPKEYMVNEVLMIVLEVPPQADQDADDVDYVNARLVEMGVAHSHLKNEEQTNPAELDTDEAEILDQLDVQKSEVDEAAKVEEGPSYLDGLETESSVSMREWDPMAEHYYSPLNMLSLQPDDAEVILSGYKSKQNDIDPCREYLRLGKCRRGDRCPYDHVESRKGAVTEDMVPAISTDIPITLPAVKEVVVVEITCYINPSHFYIKFPYGPRSVHDVLNDQMSETNSSIVDQSGDSGYDDDDFIGLQEAINEYFSKEVYMRKDSVAYAFGEIVIAKFSEDDAFYRARIIESDFDNRKVKIFFVDFGNTEWTSHDNIREMLPRFLHVPFQAVECFMDIVPKDSDDWKPEASDLFRELTEGQCVICVPLYCNTAANTMTVELVVGDANRKDVHIHEVLIASGYAEPKSEVVVHEKITPKDTEDSHKIIYLPG